MPKQLASEGGVALGEFNGNDINITNHFGSQMSAEDLRSTEEQYLRSVFNECGNLEWLSSVGYEDDKSPAVNLGSLYVPLMTSLLAENDTQTATQNHTKQTQSLSALEAINQHQHLVITGAPGSGKSAFVNYLCICLAGEISQHKTNNLLALREELVDKKANDDGNKPKQNWQHGALLPVRLILRDFVASDYFPAKKQVGTANHLLKFIKQQLKSKTCRDYIGILKQRLRDGQTLILFDGLDEVSQAENRRERMVQCIHDFASTHSNNRIVVTCRPYAYQQSLWKIANFTETGLVDFSQRQIKQFIDRWYVSREAHDLKHANYRAEKLKQAIFAPQRESLHDLVKRPLLLTLTAYLHANHYDLPERRVELYESLLDLLITKWEKARFRVDDEDAAQRCHQNSLAEYLRVGINQIRKVLERLAFNAHANQKEMTGTADIAEKDLVHELFCLSKQSNNKEVQSREIIDYLQERVGIIYQRGSDENNTLYTFPHRSFQEYLAASYFKHEEKDWLEKYIDEDGEMLADWIEVAVHLTKNDPDRWREVLRLLGGSVREDKRSLWDFLDSLSHVESRGNPTKKESYGLLLAGEILAESAELDHLPTKRKKSLKRIRDDLTQLLTSIHLPAEDRVIAGRCLAVIGDPRPEVMSCDAMQFCFISKGRFFMGSPEDDDLAWDDEKEGAGAYTITYDYWVSRFPISVAQFKQFSKENPDYKPVDKRCLAGHDNTPVVYVTWHDANAFCHWLNQHYQKQNLLPTNYRLTLLSEPEWEMAAKGGSHMPSKEKNVSSISQIRQQVEGRKHIENTVNALRLYPWGNTADSEKMNYTMNIKTVSTLGVYPDGASPYGCEDMSGNVWEWSRSGFQKYPYPNENKREDLLALESEKAPLSRVLRGGAFNNYQGYVRCAYRPYSDTDLRSSSVGFRVVLSPLL